MSGPFKMKGFSGFGEGTSPLKMYGGMKASPARSFWSKIKNAAAGMAQKVKGAFGGGGGDEDGGGGGGFGGLMGMGHGRRGFNRMHDRAHAGEGAQGGGEGELGGQGAIGPQKWGGGA